RREIARLHQELAVTMIYVTHDQVEAMTLGDRIVVMDKGHVMQIDTPLNLYERPDNRFVAGFIGNPAMNFTTGTVAGGDEPRFIAEGGAWQTALPRHLASRLGSVSGGTVIMGVRPEDVSVVPDARNGATIEARLDLAESLGNEVFVYARAGEQDIVARVSPQPMPPLGSPITLAIDMEKAHFFDPASGKRITSGASHPE
ncbi:MAG: TOBE domain-containing protein, partial [Gemmatimonadaceae bacterium]